MTDFLFVSFDYDEEREETGLVVGREIGRDEFGRAEHEILKMLLGEEAKMMYRALGGVVSGNGSNIEGIAIGSDVTISGKVQKIENGCVLVKTTSGTEMWVEQKDIKSFHP